jgi:serine O-acetyltransferase
MLGADCPILQHLFEVFMADHRFSKWPGPDSSAMTALIAELNSAASTQGSVRPTRAKTITWAGGLLGLLFPESPDRSSRMSKMTLERALKDSVEILKGLLAHLPSADRDRVVIDFFEELPNIRHQLLADAVAIERGDPAAASVEEVVLAYPGFLAVAIYRLAHQLHCSGVPLIPRILTEWGHERTGIDIHPGASLGHPIVIDHGTGIVIGETTIIGNNVKLYQGVTLGALSVAKDLASIKRHPTIEDDVIIYANATILGGETVIGAGSIIGGNTWITSSVPPGSLVYQRAEVHIRAGAEDFGSPDFVI